MDENIQKIYVKSPPDMKSIAQDKKFPSSAFRQGNLKWDPNCPCSGK